MKRNKLIQICDRYVNTNDEIENVIAIRTNRPKQKRQND